MDNNGITGISAAIILISILLITGATTALILGDSTGASEDDYEQIINETLDEISTYIQIKDAIGKYIDNEGTKQIQKITLLLKPLFSINIELSDLTVKLDNGEQILLISYSGQAEQINGNHLFEHPLWNEQNQQEFSFLIILDKDHSIQDYHTINDHTDMAYLTLKLPQEFQLEKGEILHITLFPTPGIERTISIKAPLPITPIVSLR